VGEFDGFRARLVPRHSQPRHAPEFVAAPNIVWRAVVSKKHTTFVAKNIINLYKNRWREKVEYSTKHWPCMM
jgi:hypothetical protein